MRQISCDEMVKFLDSYLGKQIEIGVSFPIWSVHTYQNFGLNNNEDVLTFYDAGNKTRQELVFNKDQIVEIMLTEGENIYDSVVSIELKHGKIDFCISSNPVKCFKCGKIIDVPYETKWSIQGTGGYDSKLDGDKLDIPVCDNCIFYDILGYQDGQFDEVGDVDEVGNVVYIH